MLYVFSMSLPKKTLPKKLQKKATKNNIQICSQLFCPSYKTCKNKTKKKHDYVNLVIVRRWNRDQNLINRPAPPGVTYLLTHTHKQRHMNQIMQLTIHAYHALVHVFCESVVSGCDMNLWLLMQAQMKKITFQVFTRQSTLDDDQAVWESGSHCALVGGEGAPGHQG